MLRSRGFSLLEVMLALVVVAIGISVLLTFSASSQRETANKATGNDYSMVVNTILSQFINDTNTCNSSNNCDSLTVTDEDAYTYLAKENTLSSKIQAGIDFSSIMLTIKTRRSDDPYTE